MTKRPLVETKIRTEFGDVLDDPSFHDVAGADRDLTYVPGFSDMRRARDIALADIASGKRQKHEVTLTPLPVNVRWVRTTTVGGSPDGRKQIMAGNLGYTAVTKDSIGEPWLTALPPGCVVNADGTLQKGDTMLFVADGATAARNAARKAAQTARMTDVASIGAAPGGLLNVASRKQGTDAFVRKEA